jgi:hypothetical protein
MAETVTYLDFGTPRIHLAQSNGGLGSNLPRCGWRAIQKPTDHLPARFRDRPGLYPAEMCKRCLATLTQPISDHKSGEGR